MMRKKYYVVWSILATMAFLPVHAFVVDTDGKLKISADDGSFSARVTGMIHVDGDFYQSGSKDRELISGTYIRRARIGVKGNIREWLYELTYDNAGDQPELKDASLARWLGPGKFTLGQFKVFEGMEQITTSNDITFIERSYLSEVMPSFQIGVGYNGAAGPLGFAATVYNTRNASDDEPKPTNNGVGTTARGYVAPIREENLVLHLGGSAARVKTDPVGDRVRVSPAGRAEEYRNGEEFRFKIYDQYDPDDMDMRARVTRYNMEGLFIDGPLSLQGEYLIGSAKTDNHPSDDFEAWYAQASYFLTGEARRYDFNDGRLTRPEPQRLAGAVEIAARYQSAKRKKIDPGTLTNTDYGITYYANNNIRFMVNYSLPNNKLTNDKPKLLSVRTQVCF